jgi:predicted dehydrogenase
MDVDCNFDIVGRNPASCALIQSEIGKEVYSEGIEDYLEKRGTPTNAIVAVSFENLTKVSTALINAGTRNILLEKPGALSSFEISGLLNTAESKGSQVWIGYNRRFYESVQYARAMIAADGGALSCTFEFTEWPHKIVPWTASSEAKERLVIANSSHVIDLAFHLCGNPSQWVAYHSGGLPWHSSSSAFVGAGITDNGCLFSYHANWESQGRWGVEVFSPKKRYILRPLEKLATSDIGTIDVNAVPLNSIYDTTFKPGLYLQTVAFLRGDENILCSLKRQVEMISIYEKLAGYA